MKIAFLLTHATNKPSGGYRLTYEYANRLNNKGHDVSIIFFNDDTLKKYKCPRVIKFLYAEFKTVKYPHWFSLEKEVKKINGFGGHVPNNFDVVIATAVETVEPMEKYFASSKKGYFIQGFETWDNSEEYVRKTYRKGFINIVVSNWLKRIVEEESKREAYWISNPIDMSEYPIIKSFESRERHSIGVLYNPVKCKGFEDAYKSIINLKEKYPDLIVYMFGTKDRLEHWPQWIKYTKNASKEQTIQIYNKVQVFLCTSIEEGFGLTGMEAMACGAALVTTRFESVLDYAIADTNALVVPVGDIEAITSAVSLLFDNEETRCKIVLGAAESLKSRSWEVAVEKFEQALEGGKQCQNYYQ